MVARKTSVRVLVGSIPASGNFVWIDSRVGKCTVPLAKVAGSSPGPKDENFSSLFSNPPDSVELSRTFQYPFTMGTSCLFGEGVGRKGVQDAGGSDPEHTP